MAPFALIGISILVVGLFFLIAWVLQWLWNMTMPQVFDLREITFWQSFRLMLIAGILLGGQYINFN